MYAFKLSGEKSAAVAPVMLSATLLWLVPLLVEDEHLVGRGKRIRHNHRVAIGRNCQYFSRHRDELTDGCRIVCGIKHHQSLSPQLSSISSQVSILALPIEDQRIGRGRKIDWCSDSSSRRSSTCCRGDGDCRADATFRGAATRACNIRCRALGRSGWGHDQVHYAFGVDRQDGKNPDIASRWRTGSNDARAARLQSRDAAAAGYARDGRIRRTPSQKRSSSNGRAQSVKYGRSDGF